MRTSLKKTMSKQWENNERSLIEGVYIRKKHRDEIVLIAMYNVMCVYSM